MNPNSQDQNNAAAETAANSIDDAALGALKRDQALLLSPAMRMRWFNLRQVKHAELLRVARQLAALRQAAVALESRQLLPDPSMCARGTGLWAPKN